MLDGFNQQSFKKKLYNPFFLILCNVLQTKIIKKMICFKFSLIKKIISISSYFNLIFEFKKKKQKKNNNGKIN